MKKWLWCVLVPAAAWLLALPVHAQVPTPEDVTRAVPPEAEQLLEGTAVAPETESTLENLLDRLEEAVKEYGGQALASAGAVTAAALFCSLVSAGASPGRKTPDHSVLAGALAVTALTAGNIHTFLQEARQAVESLSAFSAALLPVLASCAAASGRAAFGAAGYAVTAFFMDLLIRGARTCAVPLVCGFTALSFGGAALDNEGLRTAAKLMHKVLLGLLTVLMLSFTLFLTTAGAITGAAGATATKLTRTAISTVLPVVGGIVSDAAAAVVNAASMLKSSVGVYGLLAVCALCIGPVVKLALYALMYRAAGALAGAAAEPRLAGLISAMGDAAAMMLGITGACAMMVFLSVTCLVRVGGA